MTKFSTLVMCVFFCTFLQSCSTTQQNESPLAFDTSLYYLDNAYHYEINKKHVENEKEIFGLSSEMKRFVRQDLMPIHDYSMRARAIENFIFDNDYLGMSYHLDADMTASETFKNKSANCLSLTIMAYSLARAADLNVIFQDVEVPEYWERHGNYSALTGHVNLLVSKPKIITHFPYRVFSFKPFEIDFNNYNEISGMKRVMLSKSDVITLFYNNKAARAMVNKKFDLAYAYAKAATITNPYSSSSWSNLGVLYKVNGHTGFAQQAYELAIKLDPDNLTAQNNLANLLLVNGESLAAKQIFDKIDRERKLNPHYQALLATEAYYKKEYQKSVKLYRKAIHMSPRTHEFHFGLAKSYVAIGEYLKAEKALKKAIKYNEYPDKNRQYTSKLDYLRDRVIE